MQPMSKPLKMAGEGADDHKRYYSMKAAEVKQLDISGNCHVNITRHKSSCPTVHLDDLLNVTHRQTLSNRSQPPRGEVGFEDVDHCSG